MVFQKETMMKVTIEISLYPLREDYTGIIIEFIKGLKSNSSIQVRSTAMSTYVSGDYDTVMNTVNMELKNVYQQIPDCSAVMKIIPKDLNIEEGYLNF